MPDNFARWWVGEDACGPRPRRHGPLDMSRQTAPETASQERAAGRPPGQLWQVPTFFAGLLALVGVGLTTALSPPATGRQFAHDLDTLRHALKDPAAPVEHLLGLAESAVERAREYPQRAGEAHFLLGLIHARLADRAPPDPARELRNKAALYLQMAEARNNVPGADLPRLHYHLGRLLYLNGDLPRAVEYLARSAGQGADDPAEGYAMLQQA